jgi:uncharacterized protein YndB with AHSA1/START domain
MPEQTTSVAPITKSVIVQRTPEEAFRLFTDGIATWWPLGGRHSLFDDAESVVLEGRIGGRLYEVSASGEEGLWGTVTVWDPPHRLAYTWHPGRGEEAAQEVEVTFVPDNGGTKVELEHRGWDRAPEKRASYDEGWNKVLGRYVDAAAV